MTEISLETECMTEISLVKYCYLYCNDHHCTQKMSPRNNLKPWSTILPVLLLMALTL